MNAGNSKIEVPAPDKWMAGWDNYFKKLLRKSDEELIEDTSVYHPVWMAARAIHGTEKKLSVLDVACGEGETSCYLAKLGCNVTAFDALPSAIEVTKKKAKLLNVADKVKTEIKNMDGWAIEPESYDIIIATQCLQYLFERAVPRLKELANAIKPGGMLVYSGNIPPHYETDPPLKFIYPIELKEIFKDWTFINFGTDERLLRPGDLRGYVWAVAMKKKEEDETEQKEKA
ncbi:MAG: class I SAM-dependent methyltransferase [Candidatus Heimdallarchaeota archaeon]